MNGRRPRRHTAPVDFGTISSNPYAADLLPDVVLDVELTGDLLRDYRPVSDAVQAHPRVIALKAAASGRREREAVIGSTSRLTGRTLRA